ncbi:MAG: precorrin-6Y C5,15-methyltransferase (decarboxylating) subunit CbiT [Methanomassiliicoccales archaeon]|nr:MAG: precorrin-6Y C5,15-methyltransferase (decarboxylating) subunit CbiT [Methanomassiliicoccales archaeon]
MKVSGGPTQDEVMAVSLFKLGLKKGDRIVDVGCGTGKVSVHAARTCEKVFAVDNRDEAITATRANVIESGSDNVEVIKGHAKDVIPSLGALDGAFVGGSKDLELVLEALVRNVKGRVVMNAVMVSTLSRAIDAMKELEIFEEVVQVSVARSHEIGGSVMFRPIDPVFVIVGKVR